jgi:hypothetical protein
MKIISTKTGQELAICHPSNIAVTLATLGVGRDQVNFVLDEGETKQALREQIDKVSPASSREGVMSDVLGVVVVGLAQLTVALSKAKTLADVNAAAQPLADIGAAVDTAVKSGALKLPYMVKSGGAQGVLADMTKLSNGVAAVFAAAQTPTK